MTDRQDTTKNNKIIVFVLSCELQNSVTVFTARLFVVAPGAALVNLDDGGERGFLMVLCWCGIIVNQ